ncbi:hypothetical protein llap_1443 [Limosa lapponica baueri]|uniref:Uncharacterized protein n=1 Tax=Limosa lapponica baueri TaxID=1758121 RepID=A0A2I0UQD6_LIMLA|nr:hypothetical protein llap_1443 [Limosa lapponica baueri]
MDEYFNLKDNTSHFWNTLLSYTNPLEIDRKHQDTHGFQPENYHSIFKKSIRKNRLENNRKDLEEIAFQANGKGIRNQEDKKQHEINLSGGGEMFLAPRATGEELITCETMPPSRGVSLFMNAVSKLIMAAGLSSHSSFAEVIAGKLGIFRFGVETDEGGYDKCFKTVEVVERPHYTKPPMTQGS